MLIKIIRLLELKWNNLFFPKGKTKELHLNNVVLKVNILDEGGKQYDARKSFEEIANPLYPLIEKFNSPRLFVDIGANYGFISIIAAKQFPNAQLIMVEPGRRLGEYIVENMKLNNITNYEFIDAICGEEEKTDVGFATNPYSSQDNRVIAPKKSWKVEKKKMVSLDELLKGVETSTSVFVKIDVQGFEEMVFKGGNKFFNTHKNWVVKTEFAPQWLSSQKSDAKKLLENLVANHEVVELTGRTSYQTKSLDELFQSPIQMSEIPDFLNYIISLDKNGRGWCDLLVRAKK